LIAKDFPLPRQQEAKNGQSAASNKRCTTRNDIHIFWEQACGEALDKPLKPLIRNNFSISQQRLANFVKTCAIEAFQLAARSKSRLACRFTQDIHTFWEQACGQALDKTPKPLITKEKPRQTQTRAVFWRIWPSAAKPRPDWPSGVISTLFGCKPVEKPWTSHSSP
jgi:hypothetical protein